MRVEDLKKDNATLTSEKTNLKDEKRKLEDEKRKLEQTIKDGGIEKRTL